MTLAGRVLAGAATMAIMVGSATAANAQMAVPGAPSVPDWGGLYVGVIGNVLFAPGGSTVAPGTGAQFGFNFVRGAFVGGLEAEVSVLTAGASSAAIGYLNGRAGLLAGQRALVFGEVGVGLVLGAAAAVVTAGGGVEFGLNAHLSASFEVKGLSGLSPGPPFFDAYTIQWSLNWHP